MKNGLTRAILGKRDKSDQSWTGKRDEKLQIHSAAPQFRYIVAYFMVSMLLDGKFQGKMISVHTFKKG